MVSIINYPYSFQEHCPHVHVRVEEEEYGLEPSFHFPITVRERLFYYVEIFLGNIFFLWRAFSLVGFMEPFFFISKILPSQETKPHTGPTEIENRASALTTQWSHMSPFPF